MLLHGDGYHFLSFPVGQRCRHARNTSNPIIQDTFTRSWSWLASKHINPKFRPENRADNALENQRQQNHLRLATWNWIEIKIHLESQRQRPSSRAHTSDAKTSFSISSTLQVSHVPDVPGSVKYFLGILQHGTKETTNLQPFSHSSPGCSSCSASRRHPSTIRGKGYK